MSPTSPQTVVQRRDWVSHRWLAPSWLLSIVLHVTVLSALASWMPRWETAPVGFVDEPFREVGIVVQQPGPTLSAEPESAPTEDTSEPVPTDVVPPTTIAPAVPSLPSVAEPLTVPTAIGVGAALPSPSPRELVQSQGASVNETLGGGIPGTAFLGLRDKATRVVFVIDCSGSMYNYNAMQAAKAAVLASLQTLVDSQQFQVIFYNDMPHLLRLGGREAGLAFATEVNKSFARQEIAAVVPDNGTDHMKALTLALRLGPEVIYLLTDADEPQLSAAELDQIHRLNQGRARIHTIEFGKGAELDNGRPNFLKKIAQQNGGSYRYHDVKRGVQR
jgi:hypothetical protein